MSKYEENPKLSSDLKGSPKNVVEMAAAGANRNLKLSDYYVIGSQGHKDIPGTASPGMWHQQCKDRHLDKILQVLQRLAQQSQQGSGCSG